MDRRDGTYRIVWIGVKPDEGGMGIGEMFPGRLKNLHPFDNRGYISVNRKYLPAGSESIRYIPGDFYGVNVDHRRILRGPTLTSVEIAHAVK